MDPQGMRPLNSGGIMPPSPSKRGPIADPSPSKRSRGAPPPQLDNDARDPSSGLALVAQARQQVWMQVPAGVDASVEQPSSHAGQAVTHGQGGAPGSNAAPTMEQPRRLHGEAAAGASPHDEGGGASPARQWRHARGEAASGASPPGGRALADGACGDGDGDAFFCTPRSDFSMRGGSGEVAPCPANGGGSGEHSPCPGGGSGAAGAPSPSPELRFVREVGAGGTLPGQGCAGAGACSGVGRAAEPVGVIDLSSAPDS